jgi:pseudouridine-5'-phosphate glycosidase
MREQILAVSEEVASALSAAQPVVALESTIVTHGMPYPDNVETARRVERDVRDAGAIPATIGIVAGRPTVGLQDEALERLGRAGANARKVSRRDLPFVAAAGEDGGTTVAATMFLAAAAGIRVFATGGIGGVHRGAGESFDVSADLQELARTPVTVVCAGAKAILDLGATREYLETHSVPVVGFGTDEFPAFYCRESGHGVDYRLDKASEVAEIMAIRAALALPEGMVVANPIPEADALPLETVESAIAGALADAEQAGIAGPAVTPFLLARVVELTGKASLAANIALVRNNARVAAAIALAAAEGGRR